MNSEARTPLFDRLVDEAPEVRREARPLRTLTRPELAESVRRELERLFNTRLPVPPHRLEGRPRTVIDYGIPDFGDLSPRATADRERLGRLLREAIEAFEPRLTQARVTVEPLGGDELALGARIEGVLVVEEVAEPVSFMTVFAQKLDGIEVHAAA